MKSGIVAFDSAIRRWRLGELGGEPLRDARVVLRSNSSRILLHAVRLGLGIGTLPCLLARADRSLERVPAGAPAEIDDLFLVVHADVQRTTRVRAVIEAMEARLAEVAGELTAD